MNFCMIKRKKPTVTLPRTVGFWRIIPQKGAVLGELSLIERPEGPPLVRGGGCGEATDGGVVIVFSPSVSLCSTAAYCGHLQGRLYRRGEPVCSPKT